VDFYARQEDARSTTRWLLFAYLGALLFSVIAVNAIVLTLFELAYPDVRAPGVVVFTTFAVLAVILGASFFKIIALRSGGGAVARSLGGVRVDRNTRDPAIRRLLNVVEEMSIAAGVTMPEVYLLEHEDGINAFAAGHTPADAAIAVTRGAAVQLRRDELQGVIAHEFSHILNGDMRLNLRLAGWCYGLLSISIVAMQVLSAGRRSRGSGLIALILTALAVILVGFIAAAFGQMLQAAVSRHRERLADASAVQFTRDTSGLFGALLKIAGASSGSTIATPHGQEVAHMLFATGMPRIFETHPPIEERLKALDPSFDERRLPELATAAARDAQTLRQSDLAQMTIATKPPRAADGEAAPAPRSALVSEAATIAAQAGTLATEQVEYAAHAREAMPEGLREYVDSADHSRNLMLALVVSRSPQVEAAQRSELESAYGMESTAQIFANRAVAAALAPELRLPAVQQLFPALRRLSLAERHKLRGVVDRLALADNRIDVFEYCLALLLASSLYDELEAGSLHGNASLMQEVDAIHVLFCVLASQGASHRPLANPSYEAGISTVLPKNRPEYREVHEWPGALRDALARLVHLKPVAKKILIEGMVRCIGHDGRMTVEEGELLRTVCATLHCPLPPILGQAVAKTS
jgi:Zn-dependent protease with chaperone function